jgi:SAM-dependent methyltransferase/uncharacterized protein YbaR (Trm112 family)
MLSKLQFVVSPDSPSRAAPTWVELLRCPQTKLGGFTPSFIAPETENGLPRRGYLVCTTGGTAYSIRDGVLDLALPVKRSALTPAGWSNHLFPTPQLYERLWRRRALTLMMGEAFPPAREWALMNDWTNVQPGEYVVDLGTSTGLYARGLAGHGATILAVDLAWGMLREARRNIKRERRQGIILIRAAAENLPFHDAGIDAVVVGGSLNEMKSADVVLREARRVVRPGGRLFAMSLTQATRRPGAILQALAGLSGITFPAVTDLNSAAKAAGWTLARQELKGIVLFSLWTT